MLFSFYFSKSSCTFVKTTFSEKLFGFYLFFSVKCIKSFLKIFAFLTFLRVESKKEAAILTASCLF